MDLKLVFIGVTLLTVKSFVYSCDPETQYMKDGNCCKMCDPGTRMSTNRGCQDPQCEPCLVNEYQPAYTKDILCIVQQYCDPNKNFERMMSDQSKTRPIPCRCGAGYHCASDECLTCMPHSLCGPGHGVVSRGNHTQDTVCQVCPEHTFSNESSAVSRCVKHTNCERNIEAEGTAISNTICGYGLSSGETAALVMVIVIIIVAIMCILVWKYVLSEAKREKVKEFLTCGGMATDKPEDNRPEDNRPEDNIEEGQQLINVDTADTPAEPPPSPDAVSQPETQPAETSGPTEVEDLSQPTQEDGKGPIITHPESQSNSLVSITIA